jgi:hypothetical protein
VSFELSLDAAVEALCLLLVRFEVLGLTLVSSLAVHAEAAIAEQEASPLFDEVSFSELRPGSTGTKVERGGSRDAAVGIDSFAFGLACSIRDAGG